VEIVILDSALKHDMTNEIDVERIVDEVVTAEDQGKLRNATKQETMIVRLAAPSAIVRKMQSLVENDKELIGV